VGDVLAFAELGERHWRLPERVIANLSTERLDSFPFEAH
jgi:hypothetical protein